MPTDHAWGPAPVEVPPHNALFSAGQWQAIVSERDASIGRLIAKIDVLRDQRDELRTLAKQLALIEGTLIVRCAPPVKLGPATASWWSRLGRALRWIETGDRPGDPVEELQRILAPDQGGKS